MSFKKIFLILTNCQQKSFSLFFSFYFMNNFVFRFFSITFANSYDYQMLSRDN